MGPHFAPRARRVILLFQSGAPSQLDLFDPKPLLVQRDGQPMPASLVAGQAVDQLRGRRLVIAGSRFRFARRGDAGLPMSELLPFMGGVADRMTMVRSMHTDVINHDPAITAMITGHPQLGRPSMGAWASYGLGNSAEDLPTFVTLSSASTGSAAPPPARFHGNGFLPGTHQGVRLEGGAAPVPFLATPDGIDADCRREQLDAIAALDGLRLAAVGDPDIATRIAAHELAYRMQTSVPDAMDLGAEPAATLELYGATPGRASYANNCLRARRLAERGVRFIQLFHGNWDHHQELPRDIQTLCRDVDRATAALLIDLERTGLLDDTLVIWGGEFGRTPMRQGGFAGFQHGRDHHGKAFTYLLAGGGVRRGSIVGATDEFGYDVADNPVHVHDLHATVLHLLGLDHTRLTYRHQGRDFRLTDVGGRVVPEMLA